MLKCTRNASTVHFANPLTMHSYIDSFNVAYPHTSTSSQMILSDE